MDDVAYYDSQLQYQKRVGEIEKERLHLEREMFAMMRSDKKLQNLRVVKLRSYWQHVCEREKKARERNEELLKDFEQLEIKLSAMEARTNKLRKMKMEYDEKVKRMYPKWREEVELARVKKQLQDRGINLAHTQERSAPNYSHTATPTAVFDSLPLQNLKRPAPTEKGPQNFQKSSETRTIGSPRSRSKISNSTKLVEEGSLVSVTSPPNTHFTSTPKSSQSPVRLSEQEASVRPPPDSFADTTPQEMQQITTTSPIDSTKKTSNVVHTIPTAVSPYEGNSSFSDNSILSDKPVKVAVKVADSNSVISMKSASSPRAKSPKKESARSMSDRTHTDFPPTNAGDYHHAEHDESQFRKSPPLVESGSRPRSLQTVSTDKPALNQNNASKSPEPRPESRLSISSFGSDEASPRSNATPRSNASNPPLTANAAYQALLKQHGDPKSLEIPEIGEESDEDDLENLLSPHGTGNIEDHRAPDTDSDYSNSKEKESAPVYIPTAMSSGHSQPKPQMKSRTVPKVPWDTDTEDEFDNEDTNLSNTGGSSMWDQKLKKYDPEDFDFYD